jgi:hypothetical protein
MKASFQAESSGSEFSCPIIHVSKSLGGYRWWRTLRTICTGFSNTFDDD